LTYEEFIDLYKKKEYDHIDFKKKYIQKFFVELNIKDNNNIDNPSIKKLFFDKFNFNLNLTLSELSHVRNKIIDNYKNITIDQLIDKLIEKEPNLEKYIYDIKYDYKIKNNKSIRTQKIIIFGDKDHINLLDRNNCREFFVDATYKIIPSNYHPYKLIVLSGLLEDKKKPQLICFILMKYIDAEAYNKLITYMNDMFNFQPNIIHSDFDIALAKAIKNTET